MKVVQFQVKTTTLQSLDLEEKVGAPIATLHGLSSFKQDDLMSVVTVVVTLAPAEPAA